MNTIKVYNPQELKDLFPDAFEKAHERWVYNQDEIPGADEILDSMKGLFKAAGIQLRDYSIGAYSYCYVKFEMPYGGYEYSDDIGNFTGQKAYNWIKANILDGAKCKRVTYPKKFGGKGWRYDITKKDGGAWDCEFTGVCYDHDFIESLLDDIRGGCTLSDALHNLADIAGRLIEAEYEYMQSEGEFLIQYHLQFTEEGRRI